MNTDLDPDWCRGRQNRLLEVMSRCGWELVIVNQPEHIQWLTGARFPWVFQAGAALDSKGRLTLAAPLPVADGVAADEIVE